MSSAQAQLQTLGWTGKFNISYDSTLNPAKDRIIEDQELAVGAQVQNNAAIGIIVYQFGSNPPSTGGGGH